MSKLKITSSENILSLMPHIVEDYCRLQSLCPQSTDGNNFQPIKPSELVKKHGCIVRQIHIEKIPDCKMTIPNPRKPRKFTAIPKPWKCSCELGQSSLVLERQKKFMSKHLNAMKCKEKERQRASVFERLAGPKCFKVTPTKPSWRLTETVKNFEPSCRLLELAKFPKSKVLLEPSLSEKLPIKPSALCYNATPRVQKLAFPKVTCNAEDQLDPYKVSPKALRATLSQHVERLACPKRRIDYNQRKHPFKVKTRALNARSSKLINKLAVPKQRN